MSTSRSRCTSFVSLTLLLLFHFHYASAGTVSTLKDAQSWQIATSYNVGNYTKALRSPVCIKIPIKESPVCYPAFSIIGHPKRGTSALWFYLHKHPSVLDIGRWKEMCPRPQPTIPQFYQNVMMIRETTLQKKGGLIWGDCCIRNTFNDGPNFLYPPLAPFYAHEISPHSLLILLVGEPMHRAYAAYKYWCQPDELAIPEVARVCQIRGKWHWTPRYPVPLKNGSVFKAVRSPSDFHQRVEDGRIDLQLGFNKMAVQFYRNEAHNLQIIPQELLYDELNKTMNYVLYRLGLPDYDYASFEDIIINRSDKPGASQASLKNKPLNGIELLPETRVALFKEACALAELYSEYSEWDFFQLWKLQDCPAEYRHY